MAGCFRCLTARVSRNDTDHCCRRLTRVGTEEAARAASLLTETLHAGMRAAPGMNEQGETALLNPRIRIAAALITLPVLFAITIGRPAHASAGANTMIGAAALGAAATSAADSLPPSLQFEPMPSLGGRAAMDYLQSHGLYNRLRDEIIATGYESEPPAKVAGTSANPVANAPGTIRSALVAPSSGPANPVFAQVKKFTGSDTVANDFFAGTVAISGDTIVAGCPLSGGTGATYIFERNQGGPDSWGQVKKLTPPSAPNDTEGDIVAIDGDTLVVGVQNGTANGIAYVFERNAGGTENWGQVAQIDRERWCVRGQLWRGDRSER